MKNDYSFIFFKKIQKNLKMQSKKNFYKKILIWRYKYISERQFIYVLSILVGFLAGLGTAVLKNLTFFLKVF